MASVRTIAKRAGVSITTVSRVLNNHPEVSDAVRQRVLAASNEARYLPRVGRRSTSNLALVYTGDLTLGSPFDAAVMAGIARGMEESSDTLMILDARRNRLAGETFTQMFVRKGIRGVMLRTTMQARSICEAIGEERFPSVVIADRFDNPKINYIYSDSIDSSREAAEHLIGLGHKRIAICINVIDDTDHVDRVAGYKQALADHHIEYDPKLLLRVPALREGGAQVLKRLLTMPQRPTAVFMTDPLTAVGLISEARKTEVKIPERLSVVAFDDSDVRASVSPPLTSVCQDAAALGREAHAALIKLLSQPYDGPVLRRSLRTWFEVHDSTTVPPSDESIR